MNKIKLFFTITSIFFFSGCASQPGKYFNSDMIISLDSETAFAALKNCKRKYRTGLGSYLALQEECAKTISGGTKDSAAGTRIEKLYCPTGFSDQPDLLEGALDNIFLSNPSYNSLNNVVVSTGPEEANSCILVSGFAKTRY